MNIVSLIESNNVRLRANNARFKAALENAGANPTGDDYKSLVDAFAENGTIPESEMMRWFSSWVSESFVNPNIGMGSVSVDVECNAWVESSGFLYMNSATATQTRLFRTDLTEMGGQTVQNMRGLRKCRWLNRCFSGAADSGVATTDDCVDWTINPVQNVAWTGVSENRREAVVLSSRGGQISHSNDLSVWTTTLLPIPNSSNTFAYANEANGRWFFGIQNGSTFIIASTIDFQTFSEPYALTGGMASMTPQGGVVFDPSAGKYYAMVPAAPSGSTAFPVVRMLESSDGMAWSETALPFIPMLRAGTSTLSVPARLSYVPELKTFFFSSQRGYSGDTNSQAWSGKTIAEMSPINLLKYGIVGGQVNGIAYVPERNILLAEVGTNLYRSPFMPPFPSGKP